MSKKSPFERYEGYVLELEKTGKKFPVNQHGTVNHAKIAEDSGTRRQWYTESANKKFGPENKTLNTIMKADVKRIGTDFVAPKDPDEELSKIADNRSREANQLRQMLEQNPKRTNNFVQTTKSSGNKSGLWRIEPPKRKAVQKRCSIPEGGSYYDLFRGRYSGELGYSRSHRRCSIFRASNRGTSNTSVKRIIKSSHAPRSLANAGM